MFYFDTNSTIKFIWKKRKSVNNINVWLIHNNQWNLVVCLKKIHSKIKIFYVLVYNKNTVSQTVIILSLKLCDHPVFSTQHNHEIQSFLGTESRERTL